MSDPPLEPHGRSRDARNFFEAYGWALAEATIVLRRNGEDLSF